MDPRSLVGMIGYSTVSTKFDRYGHGTPASLEATYMRVLSAVGGSHHLVHHEGENCARIVGNDELARFRWWEDRVLAVAAFEAQKARDMDEKA